MREQDQQGSKKVHSVDLTHGRVGNRVDHKATGGKVNCRWLQRAQVRIQDFGQGQEARLKKKLCPEWAPASVQMCDREEILGVRGGPLPPVTGH